VIPQVIQDARNALKAAGDAVRRLQARYRRASEDNDEEFKRV
jgi:hypothetical protein